MLPDKARKGTTSHTIAQSGIGLLRCLSHPGLQRADDWIIIIGGDDFLLHQFEDWPNGRRIFAGDLVVDGVSFYRTPCGIEGGIASAYLLNQPYID